MKFLDYSGLQRFLSKIKTLLDSKANAQHTHSTSDVTDLLSDQHTWSSQQSYNADLNLNYSSTDVDDIIDTLAGSYTAEDFLAQNNVWTGDNTFAADVSLQGRIYAQNYYLGTTAFGDIVTRDASEFSVSGHTHTKSQITDFPTNYVTTDTTQTIAGTKTFNSQIKGTIDKSKDYYLSDNTLASTNGSLGTVRYYPATSTADLDTEIFEHSLWAAQKAFNSIPTALDSFYYIDQYFYLGRSSIANRIQILRGYRNANLHMVRVYNQQTNSWSEWAKFADDSDVVHKSGDETVDGNKDFSGTTNIQSLTINGVAVGDILTHNASEFVPVSDLSTVATSGSYDDLSDKPAIPSKTSDLTNDSHQSITVSTDTTSTTSPAHSGTFTCVDSVTRDSNGHVTAVNTKTVTLPADNNTDTKVTNTLGTTTKAYVTGTTSATTNTGTQIFDTGVYLSSTAGELVATKFTGSLYGSMVFSSGNIDFTDTTTTGVKENWWQTSNDKNGSGFSGYGIRRYNSTGANITVLRTKNKNGKWADFCLQLTDDNKFSATLSNVSSGVTVEGFKGDITGNANTATQFSANKDVTLTGDVTGTASSKAGWSVATTLSDSGVTAGTYGPSADVTGNNNATISVPEITVDAKGRVTSVANRTLTCKNNTYNVHNKTLTIQKNGTNVATFTSNSNTDVTANITVPTKTSELDNDSGFLTSHQSLSNYLTKTTNVSEMGRYIDMHYDNATSAYDYDVRLYVSAQGTAAGKGTFAVTASSTILNHSLTLLNFVYNKNGTLVKGTKPTSTLYTGMYMCDKNGIAYKNNALGLLENSVDANNLVSTYIRAIKNEANSQVACEIAARVDASGNAYTYAPTPATADNSTKIATTAFVKAQGYLTSHQSLSNYSTLANTVKSLSISGKTITVTPGSGKAYTLTTQDTVYSHPTTSGNKHIPSGGSSGQFLGWDSDGTAKWVNNPNTNTDTLMTQNVSTTNATYPILLCPTANATTNQGAKTGIFAKSVKINPSTNVISASGFSGPLTGNVTGNVTGNCSGSSGSCTGNAANVTGTVAVAHGGTGAKTRLGAVKALTDENVGIESEYFLTITTSWGKAGYCSVANAKSVLGIPNKLIGSRNTTGTWTMPCAVNALTYIYIFGTLTSSGGSISVKSGGSVLTSIRSTPSYKVCGGSNTSIWKYSSEWSSGTATLIVNAIVATTAASLKLSISDMPGEFNILVYQ